MLECLIVGDSIAVGVAQAARNYHRVCEVQAKSGYNSSQAFTQYVNRWPADREAKNTIISVGSNDTNAKTTLHYASNIRERIQGQVWWILPSAELKPAQREVIIKIAAFWGDRIIDATPRQLSPDKIHPTYRGYVELADRALDLIDKD
jgi:lysophospholipase L1-like esterase